MSSHWFISVTVFNVRFMSVCSFVQNRPGCLMWRVEGRCWHLVAYRTLEGEQMDEPEMGWLVFLSLATWLPMLFSEISLAVGFVESLQIECHTWCEIWERLCPTDLSNILGSHWLFLPKVPASFALPFYRGGGVERPEPVKTQNIEKVSAAQHTALIRTAIRSPIFHLAVKIIMRIENGTALIHLCDKRDNQNWKRVHTQYSRYSFSLVILDSVRCNRDPNMWKERAFYLISKKKPGPQKLLFVTNTVWSDRDGFTCVFQTPWKTEMIKETRQIIGIVLPEASHFKDASVYLNPKDHIIS